ncbi:transposase family protein [Micromonospora kangleipakensis]|uniref:transposase family protein n=1 Tax=Micromonospora kangleipakensis TaxID=1077942 RepID=UPI001F5F182E|nr:transposase family protein [Micromonospora kangleipakensis]
MPDLGVEPSVEEVCQDLLHQSGLHVIAYRAMLDVPRELVHYLARLLAAERRARGTRTGTGALTCFRQALMVLVWFRKGEDKPLLGAGFAVSRATTYRYIAEAITVLSAQAPDLHTALTRVADEGWSHVILDGKLFDTDRLTETTTSVKGEPIDAWYSGKHRDFGANIQAIMRPDGLPIWTSDAAPGHLHDFTCAQLHDITGALYWAASQLDLPTLADSGYEGAGQGIHTPVKQPADDGRLGIDNRTYNRLLRSLRGLGERGFALLTGRWHALRHTTASPRSVGDIVRAALVLTQFEYRYLPNCR